MTFKIPLAEPLLDGNEKKYLLDCLDSNWISGSGKYIDLFEEEFARYCGTGHAIAVSSGTAALHVALLGFGIGPGDEVIVPDLTYVATANAVTYTGAKPVFADINPKTWTVDPQDVSARITNSTKAIIAVHLYGHPAEMETLCKLAKDHGLSLLEDAAEAHGAECFGKRVGNVSDAATFSFYGNKIITTGEGGMITTNSGELAAKIRLLRGQGMDPHQRYWFPVIGYNYRITNLQAAIGLAQLERLDWFVMRRREIANAYVNCLQGSGLLLPHEEPWAKNVYWLYSVCLPSGIDRDEVMVQLASKGIETRPFFHPMHKLPPYEQGAEKNAQFPIATDVAARGINLPSAATLSNDDIGYVCETIINCLQSDPNPRNDRR